MKRLQVLPIAALVAIAFLALLLGAANFGFDYTDEGFALNSISNPYYFSGLFTRFSHVVAPFYKLVGERLVPLRQLNILITFVLSLFLAWLAVRRFKNYPKNQIRLSQTSLVSLVVAVGGLGFQSLWPFITPSYPSVTFIGLAIFIAPLFLLEQDIRNSLCLKVVLFACGSIGFAIILLAKVTTAAFVSLIFIPYLIFNPSRRLWFFASTALGLCLFTVESLAQFDSLHELVSDLILTLNIQGSYKASAQNYSVHSLAARFLPGQLNLLLLAIVSSFLALYSFLSRMDGRVRQYVDSFYFVLPLLLLACLEFVDQIFSYSLASRLADSFVTATFISLFLALAFFWLGQYRRDSSNTIGLIALGRLRPALSNLNPEYSFGLLLFLLPFAFTFGSNNGLYEYSAHACLFFPLSLLVLMGCSGDEHHFSLPIVIWPLFKYAVYSTLIVGIGANFFVNPWKQSTFFAGQDSRIDVHGSSVLVSKNAESELTHFASTLVSHDFKEKTPLLDLTTSGPGVLFFVDAKPVGWPWILGLLPGSTEVAQKILDNSNQSDLENAWIILPTQDKAYLRAREILDSRNIRISDNNRYSQILRKPGFHSLFEGDILIYKPVSGS